MGGIELTKQVAHPWGARQDYAKREPLTRECPSCGATMSERVKVDGSLEGAVAFFKKQHCSRVCKAAALARKRLAVEPKPCARRGCGRLITMQRGAESRRMGAFLRQRFCSVACRAAEHSDAAKQKRVSAWNTCPEGRRKRRVHQYAAGCPECRERRALAAREYRAGIEKARGDDTPTRSLLGDYIIERDAAGNLLPPRPRKEGVPEFTEVWLG